VVVYEDRDDTMATSSRATATSCARLANGPPRR
jgi:hypothetical protein